MAHIIKEGTPPKQLNFSFPDDWNVCKFDDTTFYRNRVEKLNGIKSVDIIARNHNILYFIEIKDFRTYRIGNKQRQKNGDLLNEVAQKFVNTLSALLGAKRWNIENLEPFSNLLCNSNEPAIEVILFVERDDNENHLERHKLTLADFQNKLRKLLVGYKVRCKVYDRKYLSSQSSIQWSVI